MAETKKCASSVRWAAGRARIFYERRGAPPSIERPTDKYFQKHENLEEDATHSREAWILSQSLSRLPTC